MRSAGLARQTAGSPVRVDDRAKFLARALEPTEAGFLRFCGLLEIQPASGGGRIRFNLSPIQRRYNAARTRRDIILKPRQVHVTTLECARDLWHFVTRPGARVVVVCQSSTDQAAFKDIAYKFRIFFDSLRRAGLNLHFRTESVGEWTLASRDATMRIIQAGASEASAAKKGRGGTVNRLHFTESAFFERADTTFNSLLESVPGPEYGSEIVNESTANGAGGFYSDQWQAAVEGANGYKPHFFCWWDHPHYRVELDEGETIRAENPLEEFFESKGVSPEQIKWYRRKVAEKGPTKTTQEYPSDPDTCFLVSGRCFFDQGVTAGLLTKATEPIAVELKGALRIWKRPKPGARYVLSADPSEGTGGDPGAAVIREVGTGDHVATLHGQFPPLEFSRLLAAAGRLYNWALIAVERNNHGHAVLLGLQRLETSDGQIWAYPNVFRDLDGKQGWNETGPARARMLDDLEDAHRRGQWQTADRMILAEQRVFIVGPNGKAEAARGKHDDLVMAEAIGWAVLKRPVPRRDVGNLPHR